jgi:hypothetical protein
MGDPGRLRYRLVRAPRVPKSAHQCLFCPSVTPLRVHPFFHRMHYEQLENNRSHSSSSTSSTIVGDAVLVAQLAAPIPLRDPPADRYQGLDTLPLVQDPTRCSMPCCMA